MRLSFSDRLLAVSDIVLDEQALELIPSRHHERARANVREIEAAGFEYLVNGKKYNGFYARLKTLSESERHPVVVLNRGGAERFGRIDARHIYSGFATAVIKAGYIVIGSQRMGFAPGGAPDTLGGEDFESALALKALIDADERADARRIGLYGASHGAITTYRLLAETDWVRAAVVVSGAVDLVRPSGREDIEKIYRKIFGGSNQERERRSATAWPNRLPKGVPLLLLYGASDWRVDPRSGLRFSEKLIDLKVPHRFVLFEGNDHFLQENREEAKVLTVAWLERFVRKSGSLPDMEPHGK